MTPKKSRSANAAKLQVKESLQLGTLPDDELMKLIAQANTAAQSPRPSGIATLGITPHEIVPCVEIATAGALLALAEKAAGHSHSDLGRALGVSRQRVKEIMERQSRNRNDGARGGRLRLRAEHQLAPGQS